MDLDFKCSNWIADAYMDSIIGYFRSGSTSIIGSDGFQEIDAVIISRPCTKNTIIWLIKLKIYQELSKKRST